MGSASVISIGGSAFLTIQLSKFYSITKEGNGGALSNEGMTAGSTHNITIPNCTFDKCNVNGGDGGVIYILLEKGTTVKIGCDSEDEETLFKSCLAKKGRGGKGGAICFTVSSDFEVTSNPGNINPISTLKRRTVWWGSGRDCDCCGGGGGCGCLCRRSCPVEDSEAVLQLKGRQPAIAASLTSHNYPIHSMRRLLFICCCLFPAHLIVSCLCCL